jgi:hypothetical protein
MQVVPELDLRAFAGKKSGKPLLNWVSYHVQLGKVMSSSREII